MRKVTAWLMVLILALGLTACKRKPVGTGTATPGNIATQSPKQTPHISTETEDVSGEYADRLCAYPWMDTYDMKYYRLSENGTFEHLADEELTEIVGTGTWKLLRDAEGYLTLHMEEAGGKTFDMYELELYEQSIYALGLDDFIFIWLLCDEME